MPVQSGDASIGMSTASRSSKRLAKEIKDLLQDASPNLTLLPVKEDDLTKLSVKIIGAESTPYAGENLILNVYINLLPLVSQLEQKKC